MDLLTRLQNIGKKIQENKIQKAKLEQKIDQYSSEYQKWIDELIGHGVKVEDLEKTIKDMEEDLTEILTQAEEDLK